MSVLEAIQSSASPTSNAPYTPAVRAGEYVFISGQLGQDPDTGKLAETFAAQAEIVLDRLTSLVEAAGGKLANVCKTTVFLTDMGNFAALNEVYARHFNESPRPARSTFAVAALPLGALVEIEAVVYLPHL